MGPDNIELNLRICSSLYKNSLIINSGRTFKKKVTASNIEFLGGNKKKILFLISNKQRKTATGEEMALFEGICKACSLTMDDIILVHFTPSGPGYSGLKKVLNFKFLITFGVSPSDVGLNEEFESFTVSKKDNEILLFAPQLAEFLNSKSLKTLLWKAMQQIFIK